MAVDGSGARSLSDHERRELDTIERGFARDPGLRAALCHGVAAASAPRPGVLALCLVVGCLTLTTTALMIGPGTALAVAVGGILFLATAITRAAARGRRAGSADRP